VSNFNLYANLDSKQGFATEGYNTTSASLEFFEGDTYETSVYLHKVVDGVRQPYILQNNQKMVIAGSVVSNAVDELNYVVYQDKFDLSFDQNGNPQYTCVLDFATTPARVLLAEDRSNSFTLELVIIDETLGYQETHQANAELLVSLVKGAIRDVSQPSINIGSYASVVSLANGIVDKRILDLRAGAPVEFDTLYELAHFAQKVRSHEVVTGDFCDYLDGKKLVDQNLTVVSLGNIMLNESTYSVSYEPWRPKEVTAVIVE
jgi:hypothetical protein